MFIFSLTSFCECLEGIMSILSIRQMEQYKGNNLNLRIVTCVTSLAVFSLYNYVIASCPDVGWLRVSVYHLLVCLIQN